MTRDQEDWTADRLPVNKNVPLFLGAPAPTDKQLLSNNVTIIRSGGQLRLLHDPSAPPLLFDSVQELVESSDGSNLLMIDGGFRLSLMLPANERGKVLEAIRPSESLSETLTEACSQLLEEYLLTEVPPTIAGNRVNDHTWGWIPKDPSCNAFALVPIVGDDAHPQQAAGTDVVRFGSWMSASMTGAVMTWGLGRSGSTGLLWYLADESEPEESYVAAVHEVEDWDRLLWVVLSQWEGDPECPGEDCESSGWELSVETSSSLFADSVVGQSLANIWKPCNEHDDAGITLEAADRTWRWDVDKWVRLDGPTGVDASN